jgi:L-ascorbate metabolism protein UlaG (beta-lactamase superfamily)
MKIIVMVGNEYIKLIVSSRVLLSLYSYDKILTGPKHSCEERRGIFLPQSKAKITYLYHSGFTVETPNHFLIFDYYHPLGVPASGTITIKDFQSKPATYVFASHQHADHFDPAILKWTVLDTVHYYLSSDIRLQEPLPHCHPLSPYQELSLDSLNVKTFGSTDQGVSFLVNADGISVFHAGDLNCWRWKEDTLEDQNHAESAFQAEVGHIAGHPVDIAFFPVDRRLEENYSRGAEYFAAHVKPQLLIPMHFGKDYDATRAFAVKTAGSAFKTVIITHHGQEIEFG